MISTTMDYSFGDVIRVRFPFTDLEAKKKRPAVVVSSNSYNGVRPDLLVMAITSNVPQSLRFGSVRIRDLQQAGLPKESVTKPIVMTLEKSLVIRQSGHLDEETKRNVRDEIGRIFG